MATKLTLRNERGKIDLAKVAIASIVFPFLATFIHESGHVIALILIGCQPYIPSVFFMFGVTPYDCGAPVSPQAMWFATLAGPLFSFLVGAYIWNQKWAKDDIARLFALNLFLYGTIPNLIWQIPGTDAYFAVTNGFPAMYMTLIFVTVSTLINYWLLKEIVEAE